MPSFRLIFVFVILWAFLSTAAVSFLPRWADVSSFQRYELAVIGSLLAALVLALLWLFGREICTSGSRGLLVARLFLSIVSVAAALLGGMYWFGFYTESRGQLFAFVYTGAAMLYLHSRLNRFDSREVASVVRKTFPDGAYTRVLGLLDKYGIESSERERERVQLAILKLSEGNEEKVREFVAVAKRDYRDVLFWADNPEEARLDTPEKRERFRKMLEKFGIRKTGRKN